jgi:uncharacterized protein (DUF1800 family)
MERRDFFSKFTRSSSEDVLIPGKKDKPRLQAGLEPRTQALGKREAYHLLRRLTFGPTKEEVDAIVGKTPAEAVDIILGTGNEQLPAGPSWIDIAEPNPLTAGNPTLKGEIEGRLKQRYVEFCAWWMDQMRSESGTSIEKMTLFWSTVWCLEFTYDTLGLLPPPLVYRNNQRLRKNRLANYKTIAEEISLDGGMILYQSLFYSSKTFPNENYMRELMELFTMGTGNIFTGEKNYTEGDIKEGSKVLTGWRTNPYQEKVGPGNYFDVFFVPELHDIGSKEFMGNTIPARNETENTEDLVKEQEVRGLINILFTERAEAISNFVCNKIYRYFVYSNKDSNDKTIIQDMATVFRNSNFDVKTVLKALLTSVHFYEEDNIGVQIKTPPEYLIGLEKQLGANLGGGSTEVSAVINMEQVLYDPPNVGSWDAYRSWISTFTFPMRVKYGRDLLAKVTDQQIVDLAKKFTGFDNATPLVDALLVHFFPKPFTTERRDTYLNIMLTGAGVSAGEWGTTINGNVQTAAKGLRALINAFFKAPDFQIC